MKAGVYQILDVTYYTHLWGNILIAPFIVFFFISLCITVIRIFERKRPIIKGHLYVSFLLVPCAFVAVYWDVYKTGQQATAICKEKGGIHVFKIAEVEGFLGATDIEEYSKFGFSYLESQGAYGDKYRYIMQDGKATRIDVDEFISDYEVARLKYKEKVTARISIDKFYITNRHTNEMLGEDIRVFIYPGWADSLFYGLTGFSFSPWICSDRSKNKQRRETLVLVTLKAKK